MKPPATLRFFLAASLCVLGLLGVFLWSSWQHAIGAAKTATRNLTEIIASRLYDDFARIDGTLGLIADEVTPAMLRPGNAADGARIAPHLARQVGHFDLLSGIYIFDAQGVLRLASEKTQPFSIGDRAHFLHLLNTDATRSFSEAQITRATGRRSISQLRAIRGPEGQLRGVISATIDVDTLARRLGGIASKRPDLPDAGDSHGFGAHHGSMIDLGSNGAILLRRNDDFKLIQRVPPLNIEDFNHPLPPGNPVRQHIEAGERRGSLRLVASTDGVRRLASFQQLAAYPFYVQVALAEEDFLMVWRHEAILACALVFLLLSGVGLALRHMARAEKNLVAVHAELQEQNMALERANAELEQFSYGISHDMRHPVRMVSSYLQVIESALAGHLDNKNRCYFQYAIDGAKHLDTMLVGLLDYSRIGKDGNVSTFASRAALTEALLYLYPGQDEIDAETDAEIEVDGEWPALHARRDDVVRLMQNLVGNALKFRHPERTPRIRISGALEKNAWRCCISDNGIGIAPGQISRLFQIFQRLHSRERYEGTGIGLAVCRKIVEQYKGKIWAESPGEGQGSSFCFQLPLAKSLTPNSPPPETDLLPARLT